MLKPLSSILKMNTAMHAFIQEDFILQSMKNGLRCQIMAQSSFDPSSSISQFYRESHSIALKHNFSSFRSSTFERSYSLSVPDFDNFLSSFLQRLSEESILYDLCVRSSDLLPESFDFFHDFLLMNGKSQPLFFINKDTLRQQIKYALNFFDNSVDVSDFDFPDIGKYSFIISTSKLGDIGILTLNIKFGSYIDSVAQTEIAISHPKFQQIPHIVVNLGQLVGSSQKDQFLSNVSLLQMPMRKLLDLHHEMGHVAQQLFWPQEVLHAVSAYPHYVSLDVLESAAVASEFHAMNFLHLVPSNLKQMINIREWATAERLGTYLSVALLESKVWSPECLKFHTDEHVHAEVRKVWASVLGEEDIEVDAGLDSIPLGLGTSRMGCMSSYILALARMSQVKVGRELLHVSPFRESGVGGLDLPIWQGEGQEVNSIFDKYLKKN